MNTVAGEGSLILWPALTLWRREVVRFLIQRSRVVGALGTPIVFWVLLGSGLGRSFRLTGQSSDVGYLEYFFPGTIALIVLFTAIFSMISIIEDRREGFLQGVLCAPVNRTAIVLGKVLGSTTLAVLQVLPFLALAPLAGIPITIQAFFVTLGAVVVVAMALSALGFLVAWPLHSTQGFHAIMNLFLMPMWMLSGALFPSSGASEWVKWVIRLNPLTYGVALLRYTVAGSAAVDPALSPNLALGVTVAFAVAMILLAGYMVGRR